MRCLLLSLVFVSAAAFAVDAGPAFEDETMQARYVAITSEVRCVKCQNEAIRDSNSRIATDLRREVRRLLSEGLSDQEIYDYLVARYGEFVLYRPPAKGKTLFIWLAPGFFLLIGGIVVFRIMRRRFAMPLDEKGA